MSSAPSNPAIRKSTYIPPKRPSLAASTYTPFVGYGKHRPYDVISEIQGTMEESIAITKTAVIGFIVVAALMYRAKTWKSHGFYVSIRLNAIVFVSFAVGLIITGSMGINPIRTSMNFEWTVVFGCAPAAIGLYYFATKREIQLKSVIGGAILWMIAIAASSDLNIPLFTTIIGATMLILCAYSIGVVNGILGPVLPALAIAQFFTLIIWGQGSKALSSDKLASAIQGAIDLGLDFMPTPAKLIIGVLLIILGLSDALNFYGLRDLVDRITSGDHSP